MNKSRTAAFPFTEDSGAEYFNQVRRQRGGIALTIFVFARPIYFLPPTVFFWEEKVAVFGRKNRLNL